MGIGEHTKGVMDTIKEGDDLIDRLRSQSVTAVKSRETHNTEEKIMAAKKEGFDPGIYNKAWIAVLGTFGSQWGINFNDAINQVVLNPPENMFQALIMTAVVGSGVAYVTNRKA